MKKIGLLLTLCLYTLNLLAQTHHWETVVYESDIWKYRLGTSEPPANWQNLGFGDSAWLEGMGGIGYGDGDDGTIIEPVESVYMRHTFVIFDKENIDALLLHADFDDAFVAYLNGTEIARENISGNPPGYNTWANDYHEADLYQGFSPPSYLFDATVVNDLLVDGNNVLAVQVHNAEGAASSDMTSNFFLSLGIKDDTYLYGDILDDLDFPAAPIGPFSSSLPIIKINSFSSEIPDEPSVNATMGIIWNPDGETWSDAEPNEFFGNIGIDKRGQSSLYFFPKNNFAIETKDASWADMDTSFLNFPREEDWVLHGPYSDKTFLRNVLSMHVANSTGGYHSRTRFVELIINGDYYGIYVLMEKIKRDNERVNIAKVQIEDIAGDELTGGYIFKIDHGEGHWYSEFNVAQNSYPLAFQHVDPDVEEIMPQQANYLEAYVDSFERALKSPNFYYGGKRYNEYIDLASFADHFIVKELAKDVDAFRLSSYYYKTKDSNGGKIYAGPVWDFNLGFGNADYCEGGFAQDWMYDLHCDGGNPFWWQRLREDELFINTLNCRWQTHRVNAINTDSINAFINEKVALLGAATSRNFNRWPVLNEYIWPNAQVLASYEAEINYLKNFVANRINWMDDNMPGECTIPINAPRVNAVENAIDIFPNPLEESLWLRYELKEKAEGSITIFDVLGEVVFARNLGTKQAGNYQENLSLVDLPKGVYFCEVWFGGSGHRKKVVK